MRAYDDGFTVNMSSPPKVSLHHRTASLNDVTGYMRSVGSTSFATTLGKSLPRYFPPAILPPELESWNWVAAPDSMPVDSQKTFRR